MADKNSSKNNFIMQAGILAAAGIISRIIGLLYRGPLQSVIGNLGLGVVTALLTTNFNDPLKAISDIYHHCL